MSELEKLRKELRELADSIRWGKTVWINEAEKKLRDYTPEECAAEIERIIND